MNVGFLTTLLTMFAGPLGNAATSLVAAGAGAFLTWANTKGVDTGLATQVAVAGTGIASALINWGAGKLGVQMNVINTGANGLKVTKDSVDAPKVTVPLR